MGNTTILELNHDEAHDIAENPQAFLMAILEHLRSGSGSKIPGGRVIAFFPRWGGPIDKAWERWKRRWGERERNFLP